MNEKTLEAIALSVRSLTMDAVEAANSGHPGIAMGCAELGALLYGEVMKHDPSAADWIDRDRFILSAGHGSMLLYSLLHLAGYGLTLDDLKRFRQVGSPTAGHPEYGMAAGIETTTGPLGQGLANGVGFAIAEQMLAARFNTAAHEIIDHYTYVLAGDGCMMEGVTSEAASLAGHLGLGKLIVFYDSNRITIDGSTDLAFTEDVLKRYDAYNWQTMRGNAYDIGSIREMIQVAKADLSRPTIILLESIIGKGAPNMQGTSKVHGAALGKEEILAARKHLGLKPDDEFYVAAEAKEYFAARRAELAKGRAAWEARFDAWSKANPELRSQWDRFFAATDTTAVSWPVYAEGDQVATRNAGNKAQIACADGVANLIGGSADLASSNKTAMAKYGDFSKENRSGRTINFGVREHAMGSITNGIMLHGGFRCFAATFMVFADYMRPPIRLAALMKLPVVYILTHDSIYVGEDGPTHQPIEHLESLRIIPGVRVLRPADAVETSLAWKSALDRTDGPTVLGLSRQNLPVLPRSDGWEADCLAGAWVVRDGGTAPKCVVVATGSEVSLAVEAADLVGSPVRIVSMFCRELFLSQDASFRNRILPPGVPVVTAEAGIGSGWQGIAGDPDRVFSLERFGESGKAEEVAEHLGITATSLAAVIRSAIAR
jgi:transketolase